MCRRTVGVLVDCQGVLALPKDTSRSQLLAFTRKLEVTADFIVRRVTQDNSQHDLPVERAPNRIIVFTRFREVRASLCTRLQGKVNFTTEVSEFQQTNDIQVLVTSPQACGVGLNLMQANMVALVEPSFCKGHEMQAYGRVVRIGQKRKVHVYRFVIADTVEERLSMSKDNRTAMRKLLEPVKQATAP